MTNRPDNLDDLLDRGYRYALSLTHNNEAAQDLLQDACLRISRRGGPWNIRYLITTIRNRHIDDHRRASRLDFTELNDSSLIGDIDVNFTSFDPQLEMALAELRDDERELLYLSVMEGYSAREIAKLTNRPRGTVLSLIHRAKKKLERYLSESESVTK